MRRKQKLRSLCVDRIILNHLYQPLCQERMQTVLDLVNDKQCAVLQRLQPAADTREKSLCSGRLLIHKELKVFHTAIRTDDSVRGCNDRGLAGDVLDSHIGNTEVCKQQFLQDTSLLLIAADDLRDRFRSSRCFLHQECQLFQEPLVGVFRLRQIPVV